jgi:hypothetical protein
MIIQGDMAKLPLSSTKYLVIVRSQEIDKGLPMYLKTKFVIHWSSTIEHRSNRELLLRELYNIVRVPELGARPIYL